MNVSKASWRLKSPRGKIKAIKKMRAGHVDKFDLLHVAASDPDQGVRAAAAGKLCSLGSIASFIKDDLIGRDTDERTFPLLDALLTSMDDDDALFDIAVHAGFGPPGDAAGLPPELAGRKDKSLEIRELAAGKIQSDDLLRRIVDHRESIPDDVCWRALLGIADDRLLSEVMRDGTMKIEYAIRAAIRLRDDEFLASVAKDARQCDSTRLDAALWIENEELGRALLLEIFESPPPDAVKDSTARIEYAIQAAATLRADTTLAFIARDTRHHDRIRLDAAGSVYNGALRETLLLEILEGPPPGADKFDASRRYGAVAVAAGVTHRGTELRLYEKIARDGAYPFSDRLDADLKAQKLGGTSCLREICEQAIADGPEHAREKACGIYHNGHRWRYRGIWEDHGYGWREEYLCAICGARETSRDPRALRRASAAVVTLSGESLERAAAADRISGDAALACLLEHETDGFAIRRIISKISDAATLLTVAHANGNAETRREAVLEAYERDRGCLGRIRDEELLCALGGHVTDADDLRCVIERIENQRCLYEIGSLITLRCCDRYQDMYCAALAKVADQTKLSALFTNTGTEPFCWPGLRLSWRSLTRLYPFFTAVLNLISDRRALGHIWLDRSADFTCRCMAGRKIVYPLIVFTEASSDTAHVNMAHTEDIIERLAEDPVLLELLASGCGDDLQVFLKPRSVKERVLGKLPAESETAGTLRDMLESME